MYISVKSILNSPEFKSMYVIAGEDGLHRSVKRVTVSDLRIETSDVSLFKEGDLYLSCFGQFGENDEKAVRRYLNVLISTKCSGLILSTEENIHLITDEIVKMCDEANFPLLCLKDNISYADAMEIVNRYIAIGMLNILRGYRIQKLLSENLSDYETMEILDSLNPNLERYICVICFKGEILSEVMYADLHVKALNIPEDIFIDDDYIKHYILSSDTEEKLKTHLEVTKEMLKQYFSISHMGVSQTHKKMEIKRALTAGRDALKIAQNSQADEFVFSTLSSFPILISMENSYAAQAFYEEYLKIIEGNCSEEHRKEILATVREYVKNKGNYKMAAEKNNQHENTIRYRINQLKSWMHMEDDNILFNETISLAVKLEQIFNKV